MCTRIPIPVRRKTFLVFFAFMLGLQPFAESATLKGRFYLARDQSSQPMVNLGGLYIGAADARLDDGRQYLEEATAILKEAILLKPASSIAFFLLGVANFKAQSFEIAEEYMNKAIALGIESRYPQARLMLANLCIQQKRWQDAIDHLDVYLHCDHQTEKQISNPIRVEHRFF